MWIGLFKDHILYRGMDYYDRHLVKDVTIGDERITGIVSGTKDYNVEIVRENKEIVDMSCTCPYASSGNSCKHMAAVLFYMNQHERKSTVESHDDSIKRLVEEADINVLKDFVIDILLEDERLLYRFKQSIKEEIAPTDIVLCKNRIDDIFWDYGGHQDFIDYRAAYDFSVELIDVLNHEIQNMVNLKEWHGAFEVIKHLLSKLGNQAIDDSGGEIWGIMTNCMPILGQIVDQCDIEFKREMFHTLLKMVDENDFEYEDYFIDDIEQLIFDHFLEREFLRSKKKRLNDQIKDQEKITDSFFGNYRLERLCLRKVKILEALQTDPKVIDNYCMEYIHLSKIRKYYIDLCIRRENYEQAISLLEEGKQQDSATPADLTFYSTTLKDLFKQLDKESLYKEELWQLLVIYDKGDIDVFREFKSLYSKKDWLKERELVFNELAGSANIDKLYREEEMYDRLIEVVMDSFELSKVRMHEDVLKKLYPEKLLQKYEQTVREMATHALGRKHYRKIVSIIKEMRQYPGSSAKISEIVSDWRDKYANRPAMMDELNQL